MNITAWTTTLTLPVSPDRDHIRGSLDAPVSLVEYGDYECPYCRAAHPIVDEIQARMGDELQFVFRHFPITTVHAHAEEAAEAAEAAGPRGGSGRCTTYCSRTRSRPRASLSPRLCGGSRPGHPEVRQGACRARPRLPRPRGLHERGAERGQRHADVLYERGAPRRLLGAP